MGATVSELAALVRGHVLGNGSVDIKAARAVSEAGPGDITFLDDERYAKQFRGCRASAALVGPHFKMEPEAAGPLLIEVEDPRGAFIKIRQALDENAGQRWSGTHPRAFVAASARIGEDVAIFPLAYVGENVVVGDRAVISPGAVISAGCRLGQDVVIHPNVVLYPGVVVGDRVEIHSGSVIGGDGFGYRQVDGRHEKVPQTGGVVIGADVEIGACVTIDRGTFEDTVIGEGTKIDNLVMIGHNNRIGRHNLLCGQVGIAGSCVTGDHVVMAGQAGIKDHTQIGDKVVVGAQAGVHRNVPSGQQILGSPAIPIREQRRLFQMIARLPEMYRQLREMNSQITLLMATLPPGTADLPLTDSDPPDLGPDGVG